MPEANSETYCSKLISDIRHGKLFRSYDIALKTEEIIEKIISEEQWTTAEDLMKIITEQIISISKALPTEVTSTNILRHLLKLIREEYETGFKVATNVKKCEQTDIQQSLHHLVTSDSDALLKDYSKPLPTLKNSLLDILTEYKSELESSVANIALQATDHIHSNEIILTIGRSSTVQMFLKAASKKLTFQVIVVESSPNLHGHQMAKELSKSNIHTTVIPDCAVFAIMSRVNKVIIGVHSVMADGGLRATSGVHAIALAAKHYSVPVMVLAHLYKLSPTYVCSYGQESLNVCASPANVLPYSSGPVLNRTEIYNPIFDFVPPEFVTLFITHQGGNAASYIYRLLSELYHPDDYNL